MSILSAKLNIHYCVTLLITLFCCKPKQVSDHLTHSTELFIFYKSDHSNVELATCFIIKVFSIWLCIWRQTTENEFVNSCLGIFEMSRKIKQFWKVISSCSLNTHTQNYMQIELLGHIYTHHSMPHYQHIESTVANCLKV